jgi:hypothetical protein
MGHELITNWLGLPAESWPPDHYTLLGLLPGEPDVARIEQQVHERMDKVRRYQLSHPEQATEAMNRLAQALVCLTDPASKRAYDAGRMPAAVAVATRPEPPPAPPQKDAPPLWKTAPPPRKGPPRPVGDSSSARTILDLDTATGPPAQRPGQPPNPIANASGSERGESPGSPEKPVNGQATPEVQSRSGVRVLVAAPVDPVFETARSSPEARRGIGTRRALYNRLAHTRQILRAWEQAGKFLSQPRRRLTQPAEEEDLVQQFGKIRELLDGFPAIVGQPGQPGQHVVAIARQQLVLQTFQMLDLNQRTALAKDWVAGKALLTSHRHFIRQELQAHRKRTWWGRTVRAVRAALNDHPGWVLLGVGLAALAVALFHLLIGD